MIQLDRPLILASQSPRRKKLLKQIGLRFRVISSNVNEKFFDGFPQDENARLLALQKAEYVVKQVQRGIVIGADTIVVRDHHILGKPKSKKDAIRMLQLLSGQSHIVYTGVALVDVETKQNVSAIEKTKVYFRNLDPNEIKDYVASGSPMDKAGAYGIQDDYGAVFVERIEGCYYNVVGFPLARFYILLHTLLRKLQEA